MKAGILAVGAPQPGEQLPMTLFSSATLKYEIFRMLRQTEEPQTVQQLAGAIGASSAAIQSCLTGELRPAGFVKEDNLYRWSLTRPDMHIEAPPTPLDDPMEVAKQQIADLKARLEKAEWELDLANRQIRREKYADTERELYDKLGLKPDCDDHVFTAVRRSFRRFAHPDRFSDDKKAEAHARFVELEQVFAKLERLRKERRD